MIYAMSIKCHRATSPIVVNDDVNIDRAKNDEVVAPAAVFAVPDIDSIDLATAVASSL